MARRVLILALVELGEPERALAELEQYLSFDLVPKDRQWADETHASLQVELPPPATIEPEPAIAEPVAQPVVEPVAQPVASPRSGAPLLVLAVGGGFQQLGPWSYGAVTAEASVRLASPLRLALGYQLGLVGGQPCSDTEPDGCLSALSSLSLGPQLRFDGALSPVVSAAFLAGFNGGQSPYGDVMLGLQAGGGVEFGPGPVGVRARGLFRLLSRPIGEGGTPYPGALVSIDLVVRAGR